MSENNGKGRGASYRERIKARAKTHEIELPTGAIFILREPDLEIFAASGVMPFSVANKMEAAKQKGMSDKEAFRELTEQEKQKSYRFANKLLRHICINPRIVDEPQTDDEIAIEELDREDFEFLLFWGGGGDSLDSFRKRRQSDVDAQFNDEGNTQTRKRTPRSKK